MKKIVFIINGGSIKNIGTSGGEEHYLLLAHYLSTKGHDISICCPKEYQNARRVKANHFLIYPSIPREEKIYDIPQILFFIYWYRIFITIIKLRNVRSDYIIAGSHLFHDIVPTFFIGRNYKFITYVYHIISEQERGGFLSFVTKSLEKISFYVMKKRNYFVFVDSERIKGALINNYGFREENIHVTKNGLDLEFIETVKDSRQKIYDICFCGRLSKAKGVLDLVEIVGKIKKYYPMIQCVLIGQGPERNNLLKEIQNNNLEDNVHLLGFLSEREKIQTLRASKVFVLPSHEEGWGIVIGEAMACGLPVVVYKLTDILEIWKDYVSWVECFNLNEFSDIIIRLLGKDTERESFVRNGLKFAKTLNWSNIIENEINIIMQSDI
jgi:glycosyltransferase involved in cell wall biosynthesis